MASQEGRATAEDYAAESLACDMERWLVYMPGAEDNLPFDEWLHNTRPSQISRSDAVGWICVRSPHFRLREAVEEAGDVVGLQAAWEELRGSGRPITQATFIQLAQEYRVTTGKWLLYLSGDMKVDYVWSLVARGCVEGRCGVSAKISPNDDSPHHQHLHHPSPTGDDPHVICIYNKDFTDMPSVYELEAQIRALGVKSRLFYKPDIYTYLGIYTNNQWGLRPTIYQSVFDLLRGVSMVTHVEQTPSHDNRPEVASYEADQSSSPWGITEGMERMCQSGQGQLPTEGSDSYDDIHSMEIS